MRINSPLIKLMLVVSSIILFTLTVSREKELSKRIEELSFVSICAAAYRDISGVKADHTEMYCRDLFNSSNEGLKNEVIETMKQKLIESARYY